MIYVQKQLENTEIWFVEPTLGQLVLKSNEHRFLRLCDINKGKLGIQVEAVFWCIAF